MWFNQVPFFINKGYRVIVYDVRGHGFSDDVEGLYDIDQLVEDLYFLLDKLGVTIKVNICGLSLGGLIAQRFACLYPGNVNRLILANTYCRLSKEHIAKALDMELTNIPFDDLSVSWLYNKFMYRKFDFDSYYQYLEKASISLFDSEKDRNIFIFDYLSQGNYEFIRKYLAITAAFDNYENLDGIDCKSLVIASDNDISTPVVYSRELASRIANSKMVIINESNHISSIDQFARFNDIVYQFLKD